MNVASTIVSGILTGIGIGLVLFGTIAGLAIADAPAALALGAGFGLSGLLLAGLYLRRFRPGWRRPWFPSLTGLRYRVTAVFGESRAARPRWTKAELDDKASLEQLLGGLPEARRERRLR